MTKWKYFDEAEFISNGTWADPELEYEGELFNYHDIEDPMYDRFREYADENGIEDSEKNFDDFWKDRKEEIRGYFEYASQK